MIHIVELARAAPQPWRNGGGQTRELLTWPPDAAPGHWLLRVSVADVDQDGPFSPFPHVQRWFGVLEGAGVALTFADREQIVTAGSEPVCFDGAAAPGCRLLGHPTRDLNLMVRHGAGQATMRIAVGGEMQPPAARWQALFAMTPMRLDTGAGEVLDVAPGSLVWADAPAGRWTPLASGTEALRAWWLLLDHHA